MKFSPAWITKIGRLCESSSNSRITISKLIPQIPEKVFAKKAAVLVPLCNRHGVASVLFNIRSNNVGTHKGQVSFPGGHINDGESAIDAATRETFEEYGSRVGKIQILGICQTIPAITGTLVTPVIGFLEEDVRDFEHFNPNLNEVQRIFSRTVDQLSKPKFRQYETLRRLEKAVTMPYFGEGEEKIWGLTALILDAVLNNAVIPPNSKM